MAQIHSITHNIISGLFNWDCQVLSEINKVYKKMPKNLYAKCIKKYRDWILKYYATNYPDIKKAETNVLATSVEGLRAGGVKGSYLCASLAFRIYVEIMGRLGVVGIAGFLDCTAIMDIMCHFLNGFK
jgi:hypothetical protein